MIYFISYYFIFFFFQAEDGIRDDLVTGVQTCALPILIVRGEGAAGAAQGCRDGAVAGELEDSALVRDDLPSAGISSIKGITVADAKRPRDQVDVAGDRRLPAKAHEDRVPLAVGHRGGLRILDADDIEVVMRPFEVDAVCQGGRRETRGDEDCGEYRKALH